MKKLILAALAALSFASAHAQVVPAPPGVAAMVCANNTVVPPPTSGQFFYVQCDANGKLLTNANNIPGGTVLITGVVGDFQQQSGGATTASSTTLTAGTSNCNANSDPGKSILVPGAAANGAILETTIASCSGNNFVMAASASLAASSSIFQASPSLFTLIAPGTGYVPGDTVTLTGGTAAANAVGTVNTTQVVTATVNAAGSGGTTSNNCTVTGTTGTAGAGALGPGQNKIAPNAIGGGRFRLHVSVAGGSITAINDFITGGNYTVNPTSLTAEPVTGCGLTGATLTITMGIATATLTNPGSYTVQANSPVAQGSSSGSGTGATFGIYWLAGGHYYYGTNNLTAIQAALTTADNAGGGIVQLPCGGNTGTNNKYLVTGGSLSVGDGTNVVKVGFMGCLNGGAGGAAGNFVNPSASGIWFDPTGGNKISVFSNAALQGMAIYNATVPFGPLPASYRTSADVMAAYNGTGVHFGNSGGGRGGQSLMSNATVFGFNVGWESTSNGQFVWEKIRADNVTGLKLAGVTDFSILRDLECYPWNTNQAQIPASIAINSIQNDGTGQIQVTLASAPPYQTGDRIDVTAAGSLPNLNVVGYPAANGSWIVGAISGSSISLAGSTFNASQTYVSGGGVIWDQTRPGSCIYYDASAGGNDGMRFAYTNWVNWRNGAYVYSGQGAYFSYPGDGATPSYGSASYSMWFDGTINLYDIGDAELQGPTIGVLDTSSTVTNISPGVIHDSAVVPNGMGYLAVHQGTLPMLMNGMHNYNSAANIIYVGDNAGRLAIGGGSSMDRTTFLTQSGADWANIVVSSDTLIGTNTATIGGAALSPPFGTPGAQVSPGVCDVSTQTNVICYGLRRELVTYTGPLVNVTRASDSATLDLTQDQFGNLDQAKCIAFQGSSTLAVNKWYDQRNNINALQGTAINQPALQCSVPAFGGRPGILYANGAVAVLVAPSSASWQGTYAGAVAGTLLATIMPTANATNNDRIYEMNGGGGQNSIIVDMIGAGTTVSANPGFSGSSGTFTTSGSLSTTVPTVFDWQYQWTNTTNVPTFTFNGTAQTLGTSTAGTGTQGTDTGQTFNIGGLGVSTTTFPGYINTFALWKAGPPAAQLEQARKVEGAYYGVTIQ